ncbi:MAG: hypothetical protein IJ313_10645 [Clostridia bacterium]|nr:hypothetical protein [Clostridia bacterium]
MVYIDENGAVLESVDLTKGRLEDAEWIDHPATAQQGHFEYDVMPGGGRVQRYVVDVPFAPARREVTAQRYIPYTRDELAVIAQSDHDARLRALEEASAEQGAALAAMIGGVADA